jgi:hypothetical protein
MALTLADALRQTGYAQDGQLQAPAPTQPNLSTVTSEYISQIPAKAAQNAINTNKMVQGVLPTDPFGNPNPNYYPEAAREFADYAPNLMGSIKNVVGPLTRMATAQTRAALPYAEGGLNLPANNTAMQRARAMGFETAPSKELYHGSRGELLGDIDPTKSDFGFHVGTAEQAQERLKTFGNRGIDYPEGANISPMLKSKYANFLPVKDQGGFHADELVDQLRGNRNIDQSVIKKLKDKMMTDTRPSTHEVMKEYDDVLREQVKQQGYQGLKYMNNTEGEGLSYAVSDPSVLRSRFAAFDPYMEKSTNPMAIGLVVPMAEEDNRKAMLERLFKEQK